PHPSALDLRSEPVEPSLASGFAWTARGPIMLCTRQGSSNGHKEALMFLRSFGSSVVVCGVLIASASTRVFADPLAPTKPSDVIELNSASGSGPPNCPFGGFAADSVNNPDGTQTPRFTIPDGTVLVVTEVQFQAWAPLGPAISFGLKRETTGAVNSINSDLM